jgi:hypothetical protein
MTTTSTYYTGLAVAAMALFLVSCASPNVKRTVYPDGFIIITNSPGAIQTKHGGKAVYRQNANAIAGKTVDVPDNAIVKQNVRSVPCGPNDGFAFLVQIFGLPDGPNDIDVEILHPLFLPPEDKLGTMKRRSERLVSHNAKAEWRFIWVFDIPTQQVPGHWSVRLSYRGRVIYEGSVEAVSPSAQ